MPSWTREVVRLMDVALAPSENEREVWSDPAAVQDHTWSNSVRVLFEAQAVDGTDLTLYRYGGPTSEQLLPLDSMPALTLSIAEVKAVDWAAPLPPCGRLKVMVTRQMSATGIVSATFRVLHCYLQE